MIKELTAKYRSVFYGLFFNIRSSYYFLLLFFLIQNLPAEASSNIIRPALINPVVIDLVSSPIVQRYVLRPNQDALLRVGFMTAGSVTVNGIKIVGGHNIVLIGGYIKRMAGSETNDPMTGAGNPGIFGATVNLLGQSGTTYIEGLLINNNNQFGVDGIDPGGSDVCGQPCQSGDFIFRNVRIEGVSGTYKAASGAPVNHADAFQVLGPLSSILIDGLTVSSSYQGINLQPEFAIGYAGLSRVNTRYPNPNYASAQANGYALWLGSGEDLAKNKPARYNFSSLSGSEVYVQPRISVWPGGDNSWIQTSIGPPYNVPRGARYVLGSTTEAYWPSFQFSNQSATGFIREGIPAGGDYVSESDIINKNGQVIYKSPY